MKTYMELLEELDGAAARTAAAEKEYGDAVVAKLQAKWQLEDYEAEMAAEAAKKTDHPELTNDALRKGFVVEMMRDEFGADCRDAYIAALRREWATRVEFGKCRREGADVRAQVEALSAGRE